MRFRRVGARLSRTLHAVDCLAVIVTQFGEWSARPYVYAAIRLERMSAFAALGGRIRLWGSCRLVPPMILMAAPGFRDAPA